MWAVHMEFSRSFSIFQVFLNDCWFPLFVGEFMFNPSTWNLWDQAAAYGRAENCFSVPRKQSIVTKGVVEHHIIVQIPKMRTLSIKFGKPLHIFRLSEAKSSFKNASKARRSDFPWINEPKPSKLKQPSSYKLSESFLCASQLKQMPRIWV